MSKARIIAEFVPQVEVNRFGNVVYASESEIEAMQALHGGHTNHTFDVTECVLSLPLTEIVNMQNDSDESDALVFNSHNAPKWMQAWAEKHPFAVRIETPLNDFLHEVLQINPNDLSASQLFELRAQYGVSVVTS